MPNNTTYPVNTIDDNGVLYIYQKIKGEMPSKTSDLVNDSTFQTAQNVADSITAALATLSIPTKTSDLQNDSGYQNATQVQNAIDTAIAGIENLHFDWSYSQLPAQGEEGIIYAIPTGSQTDPYDFYVWKPGNPGQFVKLDFNFDMSGYMLKTDLHFMTNAEIDALLND
jgi:hypothetical protein